MNGIHSTNHKFKAIWILAKKLRGLIKWIWMFYQAYASYGSEQPLRLRTAIEKNVSWHFFDTHTPQLLNRLKNKSCICCNWIKFNFMFFPANNGKSHLFHEWYPNPVHYTKAERVWMYMLYVYIHVYICISM